MKNHLIRLFLYACIALVPVSCGTRKVNVDKTENKDVSGTKTNEQVNVQSGSTSKDTQAEVTQNSKVDESQEQRITELFNENGSLKSRITELLNRKTTDNSITSKNRTFDYTDYHLVNMVRTIDIHRTVTSYIYKKTTSSQRYGLLGIGFVIGAVLGAWLFPKVKRLFLFWF